MSLPGVGSTGSSKKLRRSGPSNYERKLDTVTLIGISLA